MIQSKTKFSNCNEKNKKHDKLKTLKSSQNNDLKDSLSESQNFKKEIQESKIVNREEKKITLKDLCPEDKVKIGELMKKLAEEKLEREKLEIEKKEYESRLESYSRENLSLIETSKINTEINQERYNLTCNKANEIQFLNSETNSKNKSKDFDNPLDEIRNLKEKFSKMIENLQQSSKIHETILNQGEKFQELNTNFSNLSLMKEDKPLNESSILNKKEINTYSSFANENCEDLNIDKNEIENNQFNEIEQKSDNYETRNCLIKETYSTDKNKQILENILNEESSNNLKQEDLMNSQDIHMYDQQDNRKKPKKFLISKERLNNVIDKISEKNNDEAPETETKKIIFLKEKKQSFQNNIGEPKQFSLLNSGSSVNSYIHYNMKRSQNTEELQSERVFDINELNKNRGRKKFTEEFDIDSKRGDSTNFEIKNQKSSRQCSQSSSNSKYKEMLNKIKEKCKNKTYNEEEFDNSREIKSENSDLENSIICKNKISKNLEKSHLYEIDRTVNMKLTNLSNTFQKIDKNSIEIEFTSKSITNMGKIDHTLGKPQNNIVDEDTECLINLLNSKSCIKKNANCLKNSEKLWNQPSQSQTRKINYDENFFNLIDELEDIELKQSNNITAISKKDDNFPLKSNETFVKDMLDIEKEIDSINKCKVQGLNKMQTDENKIYKNDKNPNSLKTVKKQDFSNELKKLYFKYE